MDNTDIQVSDTNIKHLRVKMVIYLLLKRIVDIVVSLIGLVLLIPITIIIKIAYMCTGDFHKIIFTQDRIGLNGKHFKFYKFRSMVPNADGILFKALATCINKLSI